MKKLLSILLFVLLLLCGCRSGNVHKNKNSEVVIALLDTGVSSSAVISSHLRTGYNYVTESDNTEDQINHGTAVASIILGSESAEIEPLSPNAYVVPLVIVTKVDGKTTAASTDTLAKAIRESVDIYGADIINVSLGIQTENKALSDAIDYAEKMGVLVVAAVGNGGKDSNPYYPASYETVLAVGSCDKNGHESDFSQTGADVLAQGEDILLASRNGQKYGTKGTSYATGFVSATAANYLSENPSVTTTKLRDYLKMQQYFQKNN